MGERGDGNQTPTKGKACDCANLQDPFQRERERDERAAPKVSARREGEGGNGKTKPTLQGGGGGTRSRRDV